MSNNSLEEVTNLKQTPENNPPPQRKSLNDSKMVRSLFEVSGGDRFYFPENLIILGIRILVQDHVPRSIRILSGAPSQSLPIPNAPVIRQHPSRHSDGYGVLQSAIWCRLHSTCPLTQLMDLGLHYLFDDLCAEKYIN